MFSSSTLVRWCLEKMDKLFHTKRYDGCDYMPMLELRLIHVSKRGRCELSCYISPLCSEIKDVGMRYYISHWLITKCLPPTDTIDNHVALGGNGLRRNQRTSGKHRWMWGGGNDVNCIDSIWFCARVKYLQFRLARDGRHIRRPLL